MAIFSQQVWCKGNDFKVVYPPKEITYYDVSNFVITTNNFYLHNYAQLPNIRLFIWAK